MFFCLLCHGACRPQDDLCAACHQGLPWNAHHCSRCAEPWHDGFSGLCQHCIDDEPHFDECIAPFLYDFPLDQLILQGKGGRPELLYALARLMSQQLAQRAHPKTFARPDILAPVPLHLTKQQSRGCNQAGVIARLLGQRLGIPVCHDLILKVREPKQQKSLSRAGRQQNIQRAFRINRERLRSLGATHVVIVDDVITTGSTLNQLARQLRSSGVERVDGWAVARAAKRQPSPSAIRV